MKLTQEQLAQLIAQVFANLVAKGKTDDISTEDIMAEVNAIIAEKESEPAGEGDDEGKGKDVGEDERKGAVKD